MPADAVNRDVTKAWEPSEAVQDVLIELHRNDPEANMIGEALVDLDEGLQEWRYRHVKMVERTIGRRMGTGGSSGAGYLSSTLFNPVFPDLWAIRSKF
jgi:tryptophan 2,3-dioxygenase